MSRLFFRQCQIVGRYLYFFTTAEGIFCRMNLDTRNVELLETVSESFLTRYDAIGRMALEQGKIYTVAINGETLVEYDLETQRLTEYELGCNYQAFGNFSSAYGYAGKIYLFSIPKKEMVVFHCISKEIEKVSYAEQIQDKIFRTCREGNVVWLFPQTGEKAGSICLDTYEETTVSFGRRIEEIVHVVFHEDYFYILTLQGEIIRYNSIQEECITLYCSSLEEKSRTMVVSGDKLVLPPFLGNEFQILDLQTGEVQTKNLFPEDVIFTKELCNYEKYGYYTEDEDCYYYAEGVTNYVLCIEKKEFRIHWISVPQQIARWVYFRKKGISVCNEASPYAEGFFEEIVLGGCEEENQETLVVTMGQRIWEESKR